MFKQLLNVYNTVMVPPTIMMLPIKLKCCFILHLITNNFEKQDYRK